MNSHVIQQVLFIPPVFLNFHEQLQMAAMSDQTFNVGTAAPQQRTNQAVAGLEWVY